MRIFDNQENDKGLSPPAVSSGEVATKTPGTLENSPGRLPSGPENHRDPSKRPRSSVSDDSETTARKRPSKFASFLVKWTALSPRSKDRGPIEAQGCRRGTQAARRYLRGQKTAAPLKPAGLSRETPQAPADLRGQKTAAPLKRLRGARSRPPGPLSPRSKDRGPIEAYCELSVLMLRSSESPRSKDRGPIEA